MARLLAPGEELGLVLRDRRLDGERVVYDSELYLPELVIAHRRVELQKLKPFRYFLAV